MKISIIGATGDMGYGLALRLILAGHDICIGSRRKELPGGPWVLQAGGGEHRHRFLPRGDLALLGQYLISVPACYSDGLYGTYKGMADLVEMGYLEQAPKFVAGRAPGAL
mgnify:CR=1 FL=1